MERAVASLDYAFEFRRRTGGWSTYTRKSRVSAFLADRARGALRNSRNGAIARKRFCTSPNKAGVTAMSAGSVTYSRNCLKRSRSAAGWSLGESLRHARKLLALHPAEQPPHGGQPGDPAKLLVMLRDVVADCQQRLGLRHVHAAADRDLLVRDGEVIAGPAFSGLPRRAKAGRDVVLVGRLVLAEARVAIDAVDGLAGIGDIVRREVLHARRSAPPPARAWAASPSLRRCGLRG